MQLSSNSHCSRLEVTLARGQRCCCYSNSSGCMAEAVSSGMRRKETNTDECKCEVSSLVDEACP